MTRKGRLRSFEAFFMGGYRDGMVECFPCTDDNLPDHLDATVIRLNDAGEPEPHVETVYQRDGVHSDGKGRVWPLYRYVGPDMDMSDRQAEVEALVILDGEASGGPDAVDS